LAPAADGSDDLVGISGPDEGLGTVIKLGEEAIDGGLEIDDGSEQADTARRKILDVDRLTVNQRKAAGFGRSISALDCGEV
jgi:hypothetical protein